MSGRLTPFGLVFPDLARERFSAIAEALRARERSSADRDAFVLLASVGRLLQEMAPADRTADELEAHVRLLHHGYRHWAAGAWVYQIADAVLDRAVRSGALSSHLAHSALYLQLPEHRVWGGVGGTPTAGAPPEPLDGMFVTETPEPGAVAVLGIFGMRRDRPGFSAVAVDGRADEAEPDADELLVAAAREDGTAAFAPRLPAGEAAGLYSLANAGELLLLTCRLLAALPPITGEGGRGKGEESATIDSERFVRVTE